MAIGHSPLARHEEGPATGKDQSRGTVGRGGKTSLSGGRIFGVVEPHLASKDLFVQQLPISIGVSTEESRVCGLASSAFMSGGSWGFPRNCPPPTHRPLRNWETICPDGRDIKTGIGVR